MADVWDGRPQNPERDGEHIFLEGSVKVIRTWRALDATWWYPGAAYHIPAADAAKFVWQYLGPCLTPDEIEAREAAAAAKEREACSQIAEEVAKDCKPFEMTDGWATALTIRDDIRARGKETSGE